MLFIPIILICVLAVTWIATYLYFNGQTIEMRFNSITEQKNIHEAVLFVENTAGDFSMNYGYGGRDINSPMLAASVTKLFTTTCIIKFAEENLLLLDDKINLYIDDEILNGLHVYKGVEYSHDITVSDLIFQTSGLPDYFTNSELINIAIYNEDAYISFEQLIYETKNLSPRFAPNTGKAYYADINFDLLGVILEKAAGLSLDEIYRQYVFEPLGMNNTYLTVGEDNFVPHVFNGSERLERPLFIASCRASGGAVSTARDLMTFSKAFWGGELFDKAILETLSVHKRIQFNPIRYGGGYMRLPLGGLNTFFLASGELIGHSGSTGSFVFYYPKKDLHFVGDLAQFENQGAAIRFVMQLAMVV